MPQHRLRTLVTVAAAGLVPLSASMAAQAAAAPTAHRPAHADTPIATELQQAMDRLQFQQVLDLAPPGSAAAAALPRGAAKNVVTPARRARIYAATASPQPIVQQPQINATVLELDPAGRIVSSGTVLMSPQYPHGVVVPVDKNFHTTAVRWRQWDDSGWYTNHAQGTIDVVPGREKAPLDFMLPYPASVLKLMVNFGVLRLADSGEISLDSTYDYQPTDSSSVSLCGPASSNTIRGYIDASLTWSSNNASCALIKLLWDHNAIGGLNQEFQDLGLETLQLKATKPGTGGGWDNPITMSSLDTAKLLALINGGPGTLWTTPGGRPVTRAVLSASARRLFLRELGQQGWNWMLSTTNYCGAAYPAPGIPQVTAQRWIAADGTVNVEGNPFGHDVRPCNQAAQVTFAHKPGWVSNSGADAGIVTSLPGQPQRHYIIVVFSNLGDQYIDPDRPATPAGVTPPEYPQKFAQLGRIIDTFEAEHGG
jgi:Beta-lactamase enzyme family